MYFTYIVYNFFRLLQNILKVIWLIDCNFLSYIITIQHHKRKNQSSMTKFLIKNKKTLVWVTISLLLVICLILANYISLLILKTDNKSDEVTNPEVEIYMLSLSKSKLQNEAKSIAPDYQKIGAGGYIWKQDDYFYVISSAYINKNDAELVKNSIKINQDIDSEIITVKFPYFSINGSFNADKKKVVSKAIAIAQTFYTSIYDIAVSLDTGVNSEINSKLAVNSTSNTISTIYANFDTLYPNPLTSPLKELSNFIKKVVSISNKLAIDERPNKNQTYSSHLKLRYLEALACYYDYITA